MSPQSDSVSPEVNHNAIAAQLRHGDRILVEPAEGENFEGVVIACLGWTLVHNVMSWEIRRAGTDEVFAYDMRVDAPVSIL